MDLNLILTIAVLALIVIVTIYFRVSLLKYFGFYEPDGFYHFSIIREIVNNGFLPPKYSLLSGWPVHAAINAEPLGLYYATVIPYFFLRFFGVSYYTVMRFVPVLFAFLDIIFAYLLVRKFNKDRALSLLVALFIGLSMGDAARTSTTIYRGDGFVTAFLLIALIFIIDAIRANKRNDKLKYALASAFTLSIGNLVWNGAAFAIATCIAFIVVMALYAFIKEDKNLFESLDYLLGAMFVWWILANIYLKLGWIRVQSFVGYYFILLLIILLLGIQLLRYFIKNKHRFGVYTKGVWNKIATFTVIIIIGVLVVYALAPSFVYEIFTGNGFVVTSSFAATIEELQAPSPAFLFASFGPTLFTTPMALMIYFSSFINFGKDFFLLLIAVCFLPYLFMQVDGVDEKKGFFSGKAVFRFELSDVMIMLIIFYLLTAYLQINTVRFNSLLAVPFAIFTAYTFYWIILYLKDNKDKIAIIFLFLLLLFALRALLNTLFLIMQFFMPTPSMILYLVFVAVALIAFYFITRWAKNWGQLAYMKIGLVLLALFIAALVVVDYTYAINLVQADNINPSFISAMQWVNKSTTNGSVFLTLWPDGSLVEGVGNRISITDSVGSQLATFANPYAAWIFNTSGDPQFLTGNLSNRPNYLLVRYSWLLETSGIFTESGYNLNNYNSSEVSRLLSSIGAKSVSQLNASQENYLNNSLAQLYGYNVFTIYKEVINGSMKEIFMENPATLLAGEVLINSSGAMSKVSGYLVVGNNQFSPFRRIIFYNVLNGSYSKVDQNNFNSTNNQTLLIEFSPLSKTTIPINITGIYMLNTGITNSNMFKFLFECSADSCDWNNSVASLHLVYMNLDSKIFKIDYNSS